MHNALPQSNYQQHSNTSHFSHSRTRTTSSNIFPYVAENPPMMHLQQPSSTPAYHGYQPVAPNPYSPNAYGNPAVQANRRSPSVNTFSSAGSNNAPPAVYRTSPTNDIRRSTSSRSGNASPHPVSYVALLRKQKATVWCDRSQYEDPRMLAHFKAAKAKASMDLAGNGPSHLSAGRTSTGMSAGKLVGKVRHHNKPGTTAYAPDPNTYVGVSGVPMRLSATEVEGGDSEDDDTQVGSRLHHRRTGSSGRSSTASIRRANQYRSSGSLTQRRWSPGHTPERSGSLVQEPVPTGAEQVIDDRASGKARSTASGSSAEKADAVAELGGAPKLASNSLMHHALTREKSARNPEDLKRRGSVDERTMTLTSGRLFIANPD